MTRRRPQSSRRRPALGVDTGGTFTDLAWFGADGELVTGKVASTPDDPSRAILAGVTELEERVGGDGPGPAQGDVIHGTTVALNALLTGRIARAALVTNEGFRDLLEIARQERPDIYALHPTRPAPIVPRERRFEVGQRSWPNLDGVLEEVDRPTESELASLARRVGASRAESIAVCLLHSYADPQIEARVARALEPLGLPVTRSAEILPAYREIERFSTAVANAALTPVLSAYLERIGAQLAEARLSILQSSGGTLDAARAACEPVRVLFSGPAGGVVGAARAGAECGFEHIVTLDMGGTSTDVAFHDPGAGLANAVTDAEVAGHPIAVPSLDIHTIGCGGGSIVRVDSGGVLHVGPESAGADPGPLCYGRGDDPTVTDALVFLGHIAAEGFLSGELSLDVDAVARGFERLGKSLGVAPKIAAQAVLDVARAAMRRAIGVMTMQRGQDPRSLPLVAFGGGGGLHAAALAEGLDMSGALVPAHPGVLSAYGMATADAMVDRERAVLAPLGAWPSKERKRALAELERSAREALAEGGQARPRVEVETSLDLRYRGQSYELTVPEGTAPERAFAAKHERLYGWSLEEGEIELVALRTRVVARTTEAAQAAAKPRARALPARAIVGERRAELGRSRRCPRVDRSALGPGHVVEGPAIVEEYTGTTVVPPGWTARVLAHGHLWLTR